MDKPIDNFLRLIERFALPLVLVLGYLVFRKLRGLFSSDAAAAEAAAALASHNEQLAPALMKPLPTNKKKAPAVARQNVQSAEAHLRAVVAEEFYKYAPSWRLVLKWTREDKMNELAKQMQKYQCSLSGVVAEYKKLSSGRNLLDDVRYVLGDGFTAWMRIAGTVK